MSWNYSGRPADSDRDHVRFLVGDTDAEEPFVQDEEIAFAVANQTSLKLSAALVLRALAAKYSRQVTNKVGDVSSNCSDVAKAFRDRADELDPAGLTTAPALVLPSFGGLTISGKETLAEDTDAVQPRFVRGADDIPGGFDDESPYSGNGMVR